jgi:hypothetical protein
MATDKHPPVTLTREQLYELVWSKATRSLSREFGMSDHTLADVCKKHNIPRPPVGYWAKKQFGSAPPRPPLPPCDDPGLQTITFLRERRIENSSPATEQVYDDDIMELLRHARALPKVKVAEGLTGLHPLVQVTKDCIDKPETLRHASTRRRSTEHIYPINASVSKDLQQRALLFLDAVVKTVEQLGGKISDTGNQWLRNTVVSFAGEEVATIRLREKHKQAPRPPDPKYQSLSEGTDLVPAGRLVLDHGERDLRRVHCSDTENGRRIEDTINDLLIRWIEDAGKARIARREAEEKTRLREERGRLFRESLARQERRQQELLAEQKAEQSRVDRLMADAASWQKSQALRAYIQAVEERAIREHGSVEDGCELDRWLKWARQQADRLDPLAPSPPSILDEEG